MSSIALEWNSFRFRVKEDGSGLWGLEDWRAITTSWDKNPAYFYTPKQFLQKHPQTPLIRFLSAKVVKTIRDLKGGLEEVGSQRAELSSLLD